MKTPRTIIIMFWFITHTGVMLTVVLLTVIRLSIVKLDAIILGVEAKISFVYLEEIERRQKLSLSRFFSLVHTILGCVSHATVLGEYSQNFLE